MDKLWLPEGAHWDLNIRHHRLEDSGEFTGGGWKFVWHTTESDRDAATAMLGVVRDKRAAPHFVFGYDADTRFPVVYQCIPLNRAARTLQHTFPQETNRANCIQVEVCGRAANSGEWSDNYYRGLANMLRMVERRVPIPRRAAADFHEPHRITPERFVTKAGHVGHVHVPGNSHTDPGTGFKIGKVLDLAKRAGDHGLELKPVHR